MFGFRNVTLAAVLASGVIADRPAHATTCGLVEWSCVPGPLAIVPRNARAWLTIPATWRTTGLCRSNEQTKCVTGAFTLALRSAAHGRDVPAAIDEGRGDVDRVVSIGGASALEPNARYEVWLVANGTRGQILGTFRTSAELDVTAPTWTKRARVIAADGLERRKPVRKGNVITISDMLGIEGPYLTLDVDQPTDEGRGPVALRVRTIAPGDASDGATTIVPLEATRGASSIMLGGTIWGCTYSTVPLPRREMRVRIAIAAIDSAGNATDEVELAVPLPK